MAGVHLTTTEPGGQLRVQTVIVPEFFGRNGCRVHPDLIGPGTGFRPATDYQWNRGSILETASISRLLQHRCSVAGSVSGRCTQGRQGPSPDVLCVLLRTTRQC